MRWIAAALVVFMATAAQAQSPLTGTQGPVTAAPQSATPPRTGHTLAERFEAANTTHDGHLTKEQARSKMPSVARDFDAMDKDHRGYVTIDDIREHARERRAERKAAKAAAH